MALNSRAYLASCLLTELSSVLCRTPLLSHCFPSSPQISMYHILLPLGLKQFLFSNVNSSWIPVLPTGILSGFHLFMEFSNYLIDLQFDFSVTHPMSRIQTLTNKEPFFLQHAYPFSIHKRMPLFSLPLRKSPMSVLYVRSNDIFHIN